MTHLFIVNPIAGGGKALKFLRKIKNIARTVTNDYIIKVTRYPGHATEIARDYSEKGDYRIYSVGGDGTLGEIINGLSGNTCSLAVIPAGTGNDFSRSLYKQQDIECIIRELMNGREMLVDSAKVNGKRFINISSIGLDADVAHMANCLKRHRFIPGGISYYLAIIGVLFRWKTTNVEVTIDKLMIRKRALIVTIANGKYYGGGVMPTPMAKLDDGLLNVCLIEKRNLIQVLFLLPKFMHGKHVNAKGVHFFEGKNIHIKSDRSMTLNIDGEIDKAYEASFEIIPNSIRIIIPNSPQ